MLFHFHEGTSQVKCPYEYDVRGIPFLMVPDNGVGFHAYPPRSDVMIVYFC